MNHMDTEAGLSSDDTTIISELLNSSEAIQTIVNSTPLQQSDDLYSDHDNTNKQNIRMPHLTPTKNFGDDSSVGDGNDNKFNLSFKCGDLGDINKIEHMRHVHIPYILNGELYQIQTQDGENVTVKCCHCPPDRVYRGSVRSTGNFHMHIKRRHPDLLEKLHDMKVNALLERRDRLIRNRKMSNRNNRSRFSAIVNQNVSNDCSFKSEDKSSLMIAPADSQILFDSSTELSLTHTHNLKIKTVFQRHQMQQKEAQMRKWNNSADNVIIPIDKTVNEEQPLNYSLKSQDDYETLTTTSYFSNAKQLLSQQLKPRQSQNDVKRKEQNISQTSCFNITNSNIQATSSTNSATEKTEYVCNTNARTKNLSISTSSFSVSCPSVMSNFSSCHQYDTETDQQYNNDTPDKHHNLLIVKPEHLLSTENEAIDLSIHTDSGIFDDDGDDTIDENNNAHIIGNNNSKNKDSYRKTKYCNTTNTTMRKIHNTDSSNRNNKNSFNNSLKWQEVLMKVETSLHEIQREMNVRNQIESNRLVLDIAKFKFLHPGFQFN